MGIAHYIRPQQRMTVEKEQVLKQDKLPFALRDDDEEVEKDLW